VKRCKRSSNIFTLLCL